MKTAKAILEFILFGFIFVGLMILAGFLESSPLQISLIVATVLGVLLWFAWLAIVIYQDVQDDKPLVTDPELWISDGEKWVSMQDPNRTKPFQKRRDRNELFDQEDA